MVVAMLDVQGRLHSFEIDTAKSARTSFKCQSDQTQGEPLNDVNLWENLIDVHLIIDAKIEYWKYSISSSVELESHAGVS